MPFLNGGKPPGRELNNGVKYTNETLDELFSGATPYEASTRHSKLLNDTIRSCLRYRQEARPSFADLKEITTQYAYGAELPTGSTADGTVVIKVPGDIAQFDIGNDFDPPKTAPENPVPAKNKAKKRKK